MTETCPEGHTYEVELVDFGFKAHPMDRFAEPAEYAPDYCPVCAGEEEVAA